MLKHTLIASIFAMPLAVSAQSTGEVYLITDSTTQFTDDAGYSVIYLDRVTQIERHLSEGVNDIVTTNPITPEQMEQVKHHVRARLSEREIIDAYAGISKAWSLGVTHIPAVVMDNSVVYGISDATTALNLLKESKE